MVKLVIYEPILTSLLATSVVPSFKTDGSIRKSGENKVASCYKYPVVLCFIIGGILATINEGGGGGGYIYKVRFVIRLSTVSIKS